MNNVCVIGLAMKQQYINAILKYCEPDNLTISVFPANISEDLKLAVHELHSELKVIISGEKQHRLNQILYFTNYIGLNEVMSIEESVNAGVDCIIINPFLKL